MNTLLQQLEAAIAETERIALAALPHAGQWYALEGGGNRSQLLVVYDGGNVLNAGVLAHSLSTDVARHAAHSDPRRALRRVARDRKLLRLHRPWRRRIAVQDDTGWTEFGWYVCLWCTPNRQVHQGQRGLVEWPCPDVVAVAEECEVEVPTDEVEAARKLVEQMDADFPEDYEIDAESHD